MKNYHSRSLSKNPSTNKYNKSKSITSNPDLQSESEIVKNNVTDFYANSKEKLNNLKHEINKLKEENLRQDNENKQISTKYNTLTNFSEELQLKLKGTKEKLNKAIKYKNTLSQQLRDIMREVDSTSIEIDNIKINSNYKVKMLQNGIEHMNSMKENDIKVINKKIESELVIQKTLSDKIDILNYEIEKYNEMIKNINKEDDNRNKLLMKETADMSKFLAEL